MTDVIKHGNGNKYTKTIKRLYVKDKIIIYV